MEKLTRFLSVGIVIALVTLGGLWLYETHLSGNDTPADSSQTTKSAATDQQYTLDDVALGNNIQAVLADNSNLDMGVSVTDLQTGKSYHWGETASYTAASIGKLVTATAYLHMVETGQASLEDQVGSQTARAQLTKLIQKSDNAAWEKLNNIVTHEGLQAYATGIGMTSYTPDNNIMTIDDIALLLTKLASQKLLGTANTEFLLSLMKEADMRNFIVAAIPDGTEVYHKVGYLSDRLHDASIIKRADRSYVLVIFSKSAGAYDFSRGSTVFGELTTATLEAFFATPASRP